MKYLVFECGCRYLNNKVKRRSGGRLYCPEHKHEKINHVEITCIDCEVIFIVNSKGLRANRCKICGPAKRGEDDNARNKLARRFPSSSKLFNNTVDMTYEEIGCKLGLSKQSIKDIEIRALNKIRGQIELYPALKEYIREIGDVARVADDYYRRNPIVGELNL
uniref:Putative sigma-70 region domain containing protein n=1 Tax=viral metagenome TaxID=1070528 RepID=A0A6M3JIU3_9ZZZZ